MKDIFTNRTYQLIAVAGIVFGVIVFSFVSSNSDTAEVVVTSEAASNDIESTSDSITTETVKEDVTDKSSTPTEE